jgi:hypothetical protein
MGSGAIAARVLGSKSSSVSSPERVSVPRKGQYTPGLTKTKSKESQFYTPSVFMVNKGEDALLSLRGEHEEN